MTKIDLMKQVDKHNKQTKFEECEKKKKKKSNIQKRELSYAHA